MKLRIRGNSIRLRLTRSEVEQFRATGRVAEVVEFGAGKPRFEYALETRSGHGEIFAEFDGGSIRVFVPKKTAKEWAGSEQVGIESAAGCQMRILVEKDFACLQERPGESEADAFPNPNLESC